MASTPKYSFNPLNVFCAISLIILFDSMFDLHSDIFTYVFFVIIVGSIFPAVTKDKPKSDDEV